MKSYKPYVTVSIPSDVDQAWRPAVEAEADAINQRLAGHAYRDDGSGRLTKVRATECAADAIYGSGYAACLVAGAV